MVTNNENFDPSQIPVSTLVTLANVAKKVTTDNGTLTNPGNLAVIGTLTAGNILSNTSNTATTVLNTSRILFNKFNTIFTTSGWGTNANLTNTTNGTTNGFIWQTTTNGTTFSNIMSLDSSGTLSIAGNLTMAASKQIITGTGIWQTSSDNVNRIFYTQSGDTNFGSGSGQFVFRTGNSSTNLLTDGTIGAIISSTGLNTNYNLYAQNGNTKKTRIGTVWTSGGIIAESGNLEIGASTGNVYIGSVNGGLFSNNLLVTGNLNVSGTTSTANINTNGTITTWNVSATTAIQTPTLNVTGTTTTPTLNVTGTTTTANLIVTGPSGVYGGQYSVGAIGSGGMLFNLMSTGANINKSQYITLYTTIGGTAGTTIATGVQMTPAPPAEPNGSGTVSLATTTVLNIYKQTTTLYYGIHYNKFTTAIQFYITTGATAVTSVWCYYQSSPIQVA